MDSNEQAALGSAQVSWYDHEKPHLMLYCSRCDRSTEFFGEWSQAMAEVQRHWQELHPRAYQRLVASNRWI